jgi:serine protease AprX
VKALNSAGSGTTTSIINGVDFCASKRTTYNVRIINLSVGSGGSSDGTDALSRAVNAAGDAGILPVVAAGNGGPAASTIGSPAAAAGASTVCSLVDPGEGGFFLSAFSSRGPTADGRTKPDICAPGERITSVKAGSGNGYTTLSGTSMATPFVAGVAVLMLDADPTLTPAALKSKLRATAQDWRSTGADNETGAGKLQAYDAIKAAGGFAGTGPGVPAHYMSNAQSLARTGAVDEWTLPVTKTSYPIALTLNVPGATSAKDFDLYVSYWTGSAWIQKAASESSTRQETISFSPSAAGTYRVTVRSYAGSGSYYLDSSYGGGAPALGSNG